MVCFADSAGIRNNMRKQNVSTIKLGEGGECVSCFAGVSHIERSILGVGLGCSRLTKKNMTVIAMNVGYITSWPQWRM